MNKNSSLELTRASQYPARVFRGNVAPSKVVEYLDRVKDEVFSNVIIQVRVGDEQKLT